MNILITGGGCREAIDNVRCVTNTSTGRTSSAIADYFFAQGANVTLLAAASAIKPRSECHVRQPALTSTIAGAGAVHHRLRPSNPCRRRQRLCSPNHHHGWR